MSEIFEGAKRRFAAQVKAVGMGGGKVNVRALVTFEPAAFRVARKWAKQKRYTYERDGEIGGLLLAALSAGVLDDGDYDFDFEEETDVDVEDVE